MKTKCQKQENRLQEQSTENDELRQQLSDLQKMIKELKSATATSQKEMLQQPALTAAPQQMEGTPGKVTEQPKGKERFQRTQKKVIKLNQGTLIMKNAKRFGQQRKDFQLGKQIKIAYL